MALYAILIKNYHYSIIENVIPLSSPIEANLMGVVTIIANKGIMICKRVVYE